METKSFIENQKFTQTWLWLIIVGVLLGSIFTVEIAPILVTLGVLLLFLVIELRTSINKDGIRYGFFPFSGKGRLIQWTDVQEAYVRQYKPLLEYGGWGWRFGRKGTAYNTRGNMGLQLVLKNGRKILIGTQRAKELDEFMRETINHNPDLV